MGLSSARRVIDAAIANRVFPAAAVDVGSSRDSLWRDAFGRLTFDSTASSTAVDTLFDLASLTKAVATASLAMEQLRLRAIRLDEPLKDCFDDWRGADREDATVRDLLEHAAGLPARLTQMPPASRSGFESAICRVPLVYEPRRRSLYSDLGFILLGFLLSDRSGRSLSRQFDELMARLSPAVPSELTFELTPEAGRRAAPTLPLEEDPRHGRLLSGEVHDNYASALGGAAGHAGLFGTASGVAAFARVILRAARGGRDQPSPFEAEALATFTTKSAVPGSSRALGWDTMLPTSSCGSAMSASAFGHTGFTGTSLWIDPARDRYYVLLTNRACGGGTLDEIRTVRRAFHDTLSDL